MSSMSFAGRVAHRSARRARRSIIVAASAVTAALALSAPALAGVGTFGPADPDPGFPARDDDGNGAKPALCLDGPPMCLAGVPNPAEPASVPDNFEEEAFYWSGNAAIERGGVGPILVMWEGAWFADGPPGAGDQMTFGRIRIRVSGLQEGGRYTVTYP